MDTTILRLIDANCNRAREAMRVLEDYARFVLNRPDLCSSLKQLRHDLASVTQTIQITAIHSRDTSGDVGTTLQTPRELSRTSLVDVVTAAGKRLGEALRAIEEYLKTIHALAAQQIEAIRYRFYTIEKEIAQTFCMDFDKVRLYVLITESLCSKPWLQAAEDAIAGGADCLQLREKEMEGAELLHRARQLVAICNKHNVISIINDRVDIAILSGADGVHVGQTDLPVTEVRKLLGAGKIIGVSTHHIDQAKQAEIDGATYIGVGPVFPSTTKPRDILPGLHYAKQVAEQIKIPAIAIAGITQNNIPQILQTGLKSIAVTTAATLPKNIQAATANLKNALTKITPP